MAVDRRAWMAGGAAAFVTALVIWAQSGPSPEGAVRTPAPRASARAAAAQAVAAPVDVRLDLLASASESPANDGRNPFAFRAARPAAPPAPAAPPPSAPRPVVPAGPSGPPPAPPISLKFIGIVEAAGGMKLAVLTDGRVVSHGREGDIIEGRYRILKIGVESIELAHLDGRGRQTIRLTGQ